MESATKMTLQLINVHDSLLIQSRLGHSSALGVLPILHELEHSIVHITQAVLSIELDSAHAPRHVTSGRKL